MSLGPRPRTYGNLGAPDSATGQAIIRSEEGDDGKPPDQEKVMRIYPTGVDARADRSLPHAGWSMHSRLSLRLPPCVSTDEARLKYGLLASGSAATIPK